jgi:hypothetical protein
MSQPTKAVGYPEGWDLEWLSVDSTGQVAFFTSAGVGPIPTSVLRNPEMLDAIPELVRALPIRSGSKLLADLIRPDDYVEFARRGLYAYDWSDVHRPRRGKTGLYQLQAYPETPITVGELTLQLQSFLGATLFPSLRFDQSRSIDVRRAVECLP